MGVVWRAIDTRLQREVALKVLPIAFEGDLAREHRFLREARAASALNHPNIITIYEINSDRGKTFIAMEYVSGSTLQQTLQERQLLIPEAIDFACQIASALAKAHAAGIVHRDLKPANIMISEGQLVKVLDFGLAKIDILRDAASESQDGATVTSPLTVAGTPLGTPAYMSPEQAAGEPVDARSDIFSFGTILYEMLSGSRPFRGARSVDILRELLTVEPKLLDRADLPLPLSQIVRKCLQKNPEERFSSAAELASELRTLRDATLSAPAHAVPARRPVRRAPLVAASAALLLIAGGLVYLGQSGKVASSTGTTFQLVEAARGKLQRFDQAGNIKAAMALLEQAIAKDRNYAPAYAVLAQADLRQNQNTPDPHWLNSADGYSRKALQLNPDLAISHVALAATLQQKGARSEAAAEYQKALDLDPTSAAALVGLAKVAAALGRKEEAEGYFERAVQKAPQDWLPLVEFAIFRYSSGRYAESAALLERARDLTPDNSTVLKNLGAIYAKLARYDDAAHAFQKALEILPTAPVYTNLGTLRYLQGRFLEAVPDMEKAVELGPSLYLNWGNLGDAYHMAAGYKAKANQAYRRAIELAQAALAKAPDDPDIRSRLAGYLANSGEKAAAARELEQLERLPKKTPGSRFMAAVAYESLGDRDNALRSLQEAIGLGYSRADVGLYPDLAGLRNDLRYQRSMSESTH